MQMVLPEKQRTGASPRYLDIKAPIRQHVKLANASAKITLLHRAAQMETHAITVLGGCAVTLQKEQTNHSDPAVPLTQHGGTRHSPLSSRVHGNHILFGRAANEDACV